jgi:hypothetical protein
MVQAFRHVNSRCVGDVRHTVAAYGRLAIPTLPWRTAAYYWFYPIDARTTELQRYVQPELIKALQFTEKV